MTYGPGLEPTLLPPVRYAEIMRISMPHFHQMAGALAPVVAGCDDVWDQDARAALVRTMAEAEGLIADYLGYFPAKKFIENERIRLGVQGSRYDWRNAEVKTKWGHLTNLGTETLTLVEADSPVLYSDRDADPRSRTELATIGEGIYAGLTACSDPCDVAVFFRQEDGAPSDANSYFEIRPLFVTSSGGVMTIQCYASQLVRPTLWNLTKNMCRGSQEPNAWLWDFEEDNLVGNVDVYCRSVNIQSPITFYWDGICDCTGACQHSTQTGCGQITRHSTGSFRPRPSTWNGTTNVLASIRYNTPPDYMEVDYRSGYANIDNIRCRMDHRLERAIVKLTNALLPEPPCGYCDAAETLWKRDRAAVDPLTPQSADLPWDMYSQGALEAWKLVRHMARGRGAKMGR